MHIEGHRFSAKGLKIYTKSHTLDNKISPVSQYKVKKENNNNKEKHIFSIA